MGCFDTASGSKSYQMTGTHAQRDWLTKGLNLYGAELGKGMNVYQGQRVAPLTPTQKSVFDFAEGGGFITSPEQTERYFQNVIKAPAMRNLQKEVIPGL